MNFLLLIHQIFKSNLRILKLNKKQNLLFKKKKMMKNYNKV